VHFTVRGGGCQTGEVGMNESDYREVIVGALGGIGADVQRHEDYMGNYVPDVSYAMHGFDGWLELKYVNKLPRSLGSIRHYTAGQEQWLIKRGLRGSGHCYLLVGTPDTHAVFHWSVLRGARNLPLEQVPYVEFTALGDLVCYLGTGALCAVQLGAQSGHSIV
jgi:hypothetical protein